MDFEPYFKVHNLVSVHPKSIILGQVTNLNMIFHCLVSNREGLGTSLKIMGLATIDSHSQKEHNEIHKIPKFSVNQASFHWDTAI